MKATLILGIILIVIGIVSLAFGGFTYTEKESVVQVGPVEVTAQERKKFPISPAAAGVMVAAGLVLIIAGSSRR
ncbi:MAG: DUF3185 domain-containing protein [Armatimonadetes bacterium]|nr:DUF3185 domain-containing protein [Armatimonadota bacterium]MBI2973796.1 DUF3185 domain-containing protein [Armatimonadota bacterium]